MRKPLSVFVACMMALVLAACGTNAGGQADSQEQSAAGQESAAQSDGQAAEGTESTAEQSSTDADADANSAADADASAIASPASLAEPLHDDYTLSRMVVFSRHNIRSPKTGEGSLLETITPHEWFEWSSASRELSLRGGLSETAMGQYFRKWLDAEGFIPENWVPEDGQVRFYSNTRQRTIATAQYFSSGMLPTANVRIEHDDNLEEMDPTFLPGFTYMSDAYAEAVRAQVDERAGEGGVASATQNYADELALVEDVIDLADSPAYKSGEITTLNANDTALELELGDEPHLTGSLNNANSVVDALVLQYYEEPDDTRAAFGKKLTAEQWKSISSVKNYYSETLFCAPLVAPAIAHPLLQELRSELTTDGRIFSFLCGHDSNIASMLAALKVQDYDLPATIEDQPIGVKLTFEVWQDGAGKSYVKPLLIYPNVDQLRSLSILDLKNPPVAYELSFEGLQTNADGLYSLDDMLARFDEAIAEYDKIADKYGATAEPTEDDEAEELPAAA